MPKAYLYIRYSTAEQALGDSENRQIRLAADFVTRRPDLNLELVGDPVFIDAGVSSFMGDNLAPDKALGKFMAAVKRGEIASGSALLIESLDRLSRQEIVPAQRVFLDLLHCGITIITTSLAETHVYDTRTGYVDLIVMITRLERAHQESALKSKRVKDAWTSKRKEARNKTIITRICPHWLTVSDDGKKFEVIKERANVVKQIFSLAETMGYQSIARHLNEKRVKPFSDRSKGWQSSNIVKILLSPAATGTYQPRTIEHVRTQGGTVRRTRNEGPPIEGYYPAVVSRATFDRIQLLKSVRTTKSAGRKGSTVSNLFSHVASCGLCGANMVLVQKGGGQKGTHLVCSIARRGAGCEYRSWPYEALEASFLDYCQNIDLSAVVPQDSGDDRLVELQRKKEELLGQIKSKQDALERSTNDIANNGGVVPKILQFHLAKCENDIEILHAEYEQVRITIEQEEVLRRSKREFPQMFADVKKKLAAAQGPELFKLRSELQKVIRQSVLAMQLYHTPASLAASFREQWPTLPTVTHHYKIAFRVGFARGLYFRRGQPVLIMDNDAPKGYANVTLLPFVSKSHHSAATVRASDGKWTKQRTS